MNDSIQLGKEVVQDPEFTCTVCGFLNFVLVRESILSRRKRAAIRIT
jgi:hypothetical protein